MQCDTVHHNKDVLIRFAEPCDAKRLQELHDSFLQDKGNLDGSTGFFSSRSDHDYIRRVLESGDGYAQIVEKQLDGVRVALAALLAVDWQKYIAGDHGRIMRCLRSSELHEYLDVNALYMKWVVSTRRGCGKLLREAFYNQARNLGVDSVLCSIAEAPIVNHRSICVHEADGWTRQGGFGHKKYSWGLFERRLNA